MTRTPSSGGRADALLGRLAQHHRVSRLIGMSQFGILERHNRATLAGVLVLAQPLRDSLTRRSGHTVANDKSSTVSTHLMEDLQIWETIDPDTLRTQRDGQRGLSVVTNLCSEASPQLRFLVGDFCTLTHERCACGRTHARAMGGFLGRADDMLNIRGVTLFPSAIEDAVRRVPDVGEEFLIVLSRQNEMDVLTVQEEARPEIANDQHAAIVRKVETEIVSRCELRPQIELLTYGTLPKTEFKAKRVKDLR